MNRVNLSWISTEILKILEQGRTQGYARTIQGTLCELKDLAPKSPEGDFSFYSVRKDLSFKLKSISIRELGRMEYVPTVLNIKSSRKNDFLSRTEVPQGWARVPRDRTRVPRDRTEVPRDRTEVPRDRTGSSPRWKNSFTK